VVVNFQIATWQVVLSHIVCYRTDVKLELAIIKSDCSVPGSVSHLRGMQRNEQPKVTM
jgi:hypothetical protein